jgi:soluble lytic murein transglycosylase-like protein
MNQADITRKIQRMLSRRDGLMILFGASLTLLIIGGVTLMKHAKTPLAYQHGITIPWLPSTVTRWQKPIDDMSKRYDIDPNLIAILMTMESGGYSKAQSEVGAQGLMQITPLTAKDIASRYLKKPVSHYNIMDPKTNIEFGTAYLALLRDEYGTWQQGPSWSYTVELMAAAYNGGFGAANSIDHGTGLRDTQTVVYSRDAFNMWRERHAKNSPTFDRWKERGGSSLLEQAATEK